MSEDQTRQVRFTRGINYNDLHLQAMMLLREAGIEEPEVDSRLLLEQVSGLNRTGLLLHAREQVPASQLASLEELVQRRLTREPVAYILGEREFWSLPFVVSPAVLIPRPETEFLVELVLQYRGSSTAEPGPVVDLCCGSGIIGIVLAKETGLPVIGIDISRPALDIASLNRSRHLDADKLSLVQGDLLGAVKPGIQLPLIVSNPPYISRREMESELLPEVVDHEPLLALDGGEDGLELIRRIRTQAWQRLRDGGRIYMECGMTQGKELVQLFSNSHDGVPGFSVVELARDYAGRDRVLIAEK